MHKKIIDLEIMKGPDESFCRVLVHILERPISILGGNVFIAWFLKRSQVEYIFL
jgi:hypothetical protein